MLALANLPGSPREAANAAAVGLKAGSVAATLEGLRAGADLIDAPTGGRAVITDPLFELWLRRRGLTGLAAATELED
jgi:hypothetical protein